MFVKKTQYDIYTLYFFVGYKLENPHSMTSRSAVIVSMILCATSVRAVRIICVRTADCIISLALQRLLNGTTSFIIGTKIKALFRDEHADITATAPARNIATIVIVPFVNNVPITKIIRQFLFQSFSSGM
jgi:hypothetical protein